MTLTLMLYLLSLALILLLIIALKLFGVTRYINKKLHTNNKLTLIIKIFGDSLYMVGGSLLAAAVFAYINNQSSDMFTILISIVFRSNLVSWPP